MNKNLIHKCGGQIQWTKSGHWTCLNCNATGYNPKTPPNMRKTKCKKCYADIFVWNSCKKGNEVCSDCYPFLRGSPQPSSTPISHYDNWDGCRDNNIRALEERNDDY